MTFWDLAMFWCEYRERLMEPRAALECPHFEPIGADCRLCPGVGWWRHKHDGPASWPVVADLTHVRHVCERCGEAKRSERYDWDGSTRNPICPECIEEEKG